MNQSLINKASTLWGIYMWWSTTPDHPPPLLPAVATSASKHPNRPHLKSVTNDTVAGLNDGEERMSLGWGVWWGRVNNQSSNGLTSNSSVSGGHCYVKKKDNCLTSQSLAFLCVNIQPANRWLQLFTVFHFINPKNNFHLQQQQHWLSQQMNSKEIFY